MAKKKTAKKEEPVTAAVELADEYDAPRYTTWIPDNMPVGGKSNSTEQLNDHPTEHNHSAEAISDIVDHFANLHLYVKSAAALGVDGNLNVDGLIYVAGPDGARSLIKSTPNRRIFTIKPDSVDASPTFFLHGETDASTDIMSIKDSGGDYTIRLVASSGGADLAITGQYSDSEGPIRTFAIADGIDTADILERADTAKMPVIDAEGAEFPNSEAESLTVNEVITALLAKVTELSARIEALETDA